eukprot:gene7435-10131_t
MQKSGPKQSIPSSTGVVQPKKEKQPQKNDKQQQQQQQKKNNPQSNPTSNSNSGNNTAGQQGGNFQKGGKQTKQSKQSNNDGHEDDKRDQKLQAILLADSFTKSFRPISAEGPKVLLPLVNIPMLEYSLEFLTQNGVEEIFVFCVWYADMIESYIKKSKWPSIISVKCISSTACLSAGDALRELDQLSIIRSDPFILISGDVISNLNLKKAIAFHKQKRKEDSNNVMTVVLKKVQNIAGVKPILDDLVVALDKNTSQMVLFDDSITKKSVNISLELMNDHPSGLSFHTDLLDCNVDICSPELMLQFSDNFDYQDIRKDFIQNEVGNWALGKHIYGYVIQNEYAARVQDFRTYHSICRDIVTRWVYPIVPDAQLTNDSSYVQTKRYIYKEVNVKVARSAKIEECVVLGRNAIVGENVTLTRTIVGRDCSIGNGSVISESHIWQGAIIEPNVHITQSIICNNAIIKQGAVIPRGCIISYGVIIGEGVALPEFTRVSAKYMEDESVLDPKQPYDTIIGPDGVGYVYHSTENFDEDIWKEYKLSLSNGAIRAHSIGCVEEQLWKRSLWSVVPQPIEDDDSIYDDEDNMMSSNNNNNLNTKNENFQKVITDMIVTGYEEGHPPDSLLMEVKGFKFSQNKSFADCLKGIIPAVMFVILNKCKSKDSNTIKSAEYISKLKEMLDEDAWGYDLAKPMVQEQEDEVAIILALEEFALLKENSQAIYPIFRFILQVFYDTELISEEAILEWISLREQNNDWADEMDDEYYNEAKKMQLFNEPQVQQFVDWIKSEEGDDEDEEEEEESDDDN